MKAQFVEGGKAQFGDKAQFVAACAERRLKRDKVLFPTRRRNIAFRKSMCF